MSPWAFRNSKHWKKKNFCVLKNKTKTNKPGWSRWIRSHFFTFSPWSWSKAEPDTAFLPTEQSAVTLIAWRQVGGQRGEHMAILPMHQLISDSSASPGNLRNPKQMLFLKVREKVKSDLAEKEIKTNSTSVNYLNAAIEGRC